MDLSIEDARTEVRATRRQISQNADALSERVHEGVESAKKKINPLEYAREHPWTAIGIAAGVGLGLSLTGADKRAARAALEGAKAAGGAIATGATELKDHAVELVKNAAGAEAGSDETAAAAQPFAGSRIRDRIQSSVFDLLSHGLNELMRDIRR